MNNTRQSHLFWGSCSPLASLAGGGLLIMASSRLAFALVCAGALLWVYVLSALAAFPGRRIFSRRGKNLIAVFISALTGSLYLLALWFVSPVLAMENFLILSLTPLMCAGSGIFERLEPLNLNRSLARAFGEAAALGGLIIAFSLIREPLGYLSLTLPGGVLGIVEVFRMEGTSFLPVRLVSCAAGALLLFGYGLGLYRHFRERQGRYTSPEENP
jgi:hypothetical protein